MTESFESQAHKVNVNTFIGVTVAGRFVIESKLGEGGMGSVWCARDIALDRAVAVKIMPAGAQDAEALERFKRERIASATLDHEGIVKILSTGLLDDGSPYMVMEMVDGCNLAELLSRRKLSFEQFKSIFSQVLAALAHAHDHGILHRDLKPSNIMLLDADSDSIIAKLVDFGIAKLTGVADQKLTQTGAIIGSVPFMSPEQCMGGLVDQRSDVYSLGCVMFEALTGTQVFAGESELELLYKRIHQDPCTVASRAPEADANLAAIVDKSLARDPADRFQSAGQMLEALASAEPGSPSPPREPQRNWGLVAACAGFALLAICLSVYFLQAQRHMPERKHSSQKAEGMVPGNFDVLNEKLSWLQGRRRFEEALSLSDRWLAEHPLPKNVDADHITAADFRHIQVQITRAEILTNLQRNEEVYRSLEKVRTLLKEPEHLMHLLKIQSCAAFAAKQSDRGYAVALEGRQVYLAAEANHLESGPFWSNATRVADELAIVACARCRYKDCIQYGNECLRCIKHGNLEMSYQTHVLACMAMSYKLLGDPAKAEQLLNQSVEIFHNRSAEARGEGTDRQESAIWCRMGQFYQEQGKYDKAIEYFRAAEKYGRMNKSAEAAADAALPLMELVKCQLKLGRVDEAVRTAASVEKCFDKQPNKAAEALSNVASLFTICGKFDQADKFYAKAFAIYFPTSCDAATLPLYGRYLCALGLGQPEKSRALIDDFQQSIKGRSDEVLALASLARAVADNDKGRQIALELFGKALELGQSRRATPAFLSDQYSRIAQLQLLMGEKDSANHNADQAMRFAEQAPGTIEYAEALCAKMAVLAALNQNREALELAKAKASGNPRYDSLMGGQFFMQLINLNLKVHDLPAARLACEKARASYARLAHAYGMGAALQADAQVSLLEGKPAAAAELSESAALAYMAMGANLFAARSFVMAAQVYGQLNNKEKALYCLLQSRRLRTGNADIEHDIDECAKQLAVKVQV